MVHEATRFKLLLLRFTHGYCKKDCPYFEGSSADSWCVQVNISKTKLRVCIERKRVRGKWKIDLNASNWYPVSDQKGSSTTLLGAVHAYIAYVEEFPPPFLGVNREMCNHVSWRSLDHNQNDLQHFFEASPWVVSLGLELMTSNLHISSLANQENCCESGKLVI